MHTQINLHLKLQLKFKIFAIHMHAHAWVLHVTVKWTASTTCYL